MADHLTVQTLDEEEPWMANRKLFMIVLSLSLCAGSAGLAAQDVSGPPVDQYWSSAGSPFVREPVISLEEAKAVALGLELSERISLGDHSANAINNAGYLLYERQAYASAASVFLYATLVNPDYLFAHFNRACSLALMYREDDPAAHQILKDILYHLHRSVEIDPARLEKARTDTDLAAIHETEAFFRFVQFHSNSWTLDTYDEWTLAYHDYDFEMLLAPVAGSNDYEGYYTVYRRPNLASPDGRRQVFLGNDQGEYRLFFAGMSGYVRSYDGPGRVDWLSQFGGSGWNWSADSKALTWADSNGIWLFDVDKRQIQQVCGTGPNGESVFDPRFEGGVDGMIRYKQAFITEWGYSGNEFLISTQSGEIVPVPDSGFTVQTDDTRGGDWSPEYDMDSQMMYGDGDGYGNMDTQP